MSRLTSRVPTHHYTLEEVFVNAENYYDAGFQVRVARSRHS